MGILRAKGRTAEKKAEPATRAFSSSVDSVPRPPNGRPSTPFIFSTFEHRMTPVESRLSARQRPLVFGGASRKSLCSFGNGIDFWNLSWRASVRRGSLRNRRVNKSSLRQGCTRKHLRPVNWKAGLIAPRATATKEALFFVPGERLRSFSLLSHPLPHSFHPFASTFPLLYSL